MLNADATRRLRADPLCKVKAWCVCQQSHCQHIAGRQVSEVKDKNWPTERTVP